jgi:putative ATP-dependent endonuclease of OLD family
MLKLSQLNLYNFRSIKEETFRFQPLSVLIGQNNSGKSNVLDAITILLEGTSKDVTQEEFFDRNNDFIIEGRFSGVTEYLDILDLRHRSRIGECIDDGIITVRRIGNAAGQHFHTKRLKFCMFFSNC